jgi:glycosyltransferase involved in cell wall biosynthesis
VTDRDPGLQRGEDAPDADDLRAEVDRLRLANQELVSELEELRGTGRAIRWHGKRLWQDVWQRYYIARWKLLHARDPKRGLRVRDEHDPYRARIHQPLEPERRRVLHFIGNFHTGGSARLIVDLVEHLGHRYEQRIVVRSLPPTPAYTNVDLLPLEHLNGPRKVSRILRRFRPDLVHVHMLGHQHDEYGKRDWSWYHNVFLALEDYGAPCIENLNIPVEPYVSPVVRCYVHVSDDVKARFGRRGTWNETVYPGSDLSFFSRPAGAAVPDDTIGMVYRLQPDKLDERSIEPFIEVVKRRPGTRALIVGGGQFLDLYKRRAAAEGVAEAFVFTGYVPYVDLPAHLAQLSLFVAPVHTESFGQVSPFAMGMGIPVVGYDVGALREITAAPELLARPGDASALAEIVIRLLDDRERRLRIGEFNRQRAQSLFSVEAMVRRYQALYEEVLPMAERRALTPARRAANEVPMRQTGTSQPTVTVLLAVRNGERFLRDAVESVLSQYYPDFEFLIVDDASTDRTRAILDSYTDRRIRILTNATHLGLSRSLNRGIAEARGRYIARLDADDIAEPDRLALQAQFLDRRTDVALVGSWYTIIDERSRERGRRWVPCDHHEIRWMLMFCSAFAHSAVMIRRAALDDVGLYDESLTYAMDYDLWLRLAATKRLHNLDRFLVRWRTNPDSLTAKLGEGTERIDRVTADLARRLGWPIDAAEENRKKAALLCGIVAGSPPDATMAEAAWATDALRSLLDDYCRTHQIEPSIAEALRQGLDRQTARCLFWMGHRYPDTRDYGYAWSALRLGGKVQPRALVSREGITLLAKLLGGNLAVGAVRSLSQRAERP